MVTHPLRWVMRARPLNLASCIHTMMDNDDSPVYVHTSKAVAVSNMPKSAPARLPLVIFCCRLVLLMT